MASQLNVDIIAIATASSLQIQNSMMFSPDNTLDIGASGATRPRTLYAGTSLIVGSTGKITSPVADYCVIGSGTKDAFRVISSTAGSGISISSVDSTGQVSFQQMIIRGGGAGIYLTAKDSGSIIFTTDNGGAQTDRWSVVPAGHMAAMTDNIYDIGASGSARPRSGYFGTSVLTPAVGTGGATNLDLTTSGGTQARIVHIASAVNYLQIQGSAAGGIVAMAAAGSDSNIDLELSSKGTDSIRFSTASFGALQFLVAHAASAVNYWQIAGAAATGNPSLSVLGTDSNVSVDFTVKGAGSFNFYTRNDTGSKIQFKIIDTASTVNYVTVTGNITANNPIIAPDGETNVGINLASKGTGNVILDPKSGDILWNKALVALGGGATPTFGTIGGSGPATAAQNTWMRVKDTGGNAFWVPVWK